MLIVKLLGYSYIRGCHMMLLLWNSVTKVKSNSTHTVIVLLINKVWKHTTSTVKSNTWRKTTWCPGTDSWAPPSRESVPPAHSRNTAGVHAWGTRLARLGPCPRHSLAVWPGRVTHPLPDPSVCICWGYKRPPHWVSNMSSGTAPGTQTSGEVLWRRHWLIPTAWFLPVWVARTRQAVGTGRERPVGLRQGFPWGQGGAGEATHSGGGNRRRLGWAHSQTSPPANISWISFFRN